MKFRYLIVDEDSVRGTNDKAVALVAAEECQVIDCKTGEEVGEDDAREDVEEYAQLDEEEDEPEDEDDEGEDE